MNKALEKWLHRLTPQTLPALKINCELLQRQTHDIRSSIDLMALVAEADPGLSIFLLRHINRICKQTQRSEITNARHAMIMMGVEQLKLHLPDVVTDETLSNEQRQHLHQECSLALHTAYQARSIGRLRRDSDINELYSAALFHNLGEMLLILHAPDEVEQVNLLVAEQEMSAEKAQEKIFGFRFNDLTLQIARAWHLPSLLAESVHATDSPNRERGLTIRLASKVTHCAQQGWYSQAMHDHIEEMGKFIQHDTAEIATLIHQASVNAARESIIYGVVHPASLLLLPAYDPQDEPVASVAKTHTEPSYHKDLDYCLAPRFPVLKEAIKTLNQPEAELSPREVIEVTLEGMHHGLGLERVAFASPNKQKNGLQANYALSNVDDSHFKRLSVELKGHNLFVRMMEKPTALWLDDNNRKKFFSLIPINFHKLIDNDSFFVMSLFVKDKPVGIFYADRGSRNCRLSEVGYKRFKQLVTLTANYLGRAK